MIKNIEQSGRLFVGDLHGHRYIHSQVCKYAELHGYPITFVGDYVDSFSETTVNQQGLLLDIRKNIQDNKPYNYLLGNHDISYMKYEFRCSGYKSSNHTYFSNFFSEMKEKLNYYEIYDLGGGEHLFVSHAGLSQAFLDANELPFDLGVIDEFFQKDLENVLKPNHIPRSMWVGSCRGGRDACGGILWNDFFREFKPIDSLHQVMGHTALFDKDIVNKELNGFNNFNIDNIEYGRKNILLFKDGTFHTIKKEDYYDL
jgi:hypothetical protein